MRSAQARGNLQYLLGPQAPPRAWIIGGDLNAREGMLMAWCAGFVTPRVQCLSKSGHDATLDAQKGDIAVSQGLALKHCQACVGAHNQPCASDVHDCVHVVGEVPQQYLAMYERFTSGQLDGEVDALTREYGYGQLRTEDQWLGPLGFSRGSHA